MGSLLGIVGPCEKRARRKPKRSLSSSARTRGASARSARTAGRMLYRGCTSSRRAAFFDALLAKYGTGTPGRPKGVYPRLDEVTVYAIAVERITGKHCPLPPLAEQWPAKDRTKSPNARP